MGFIIQKYIEQIISEVEEPEQQPKEEIYVRNGAQVKKATQTKNEMQMKGKTQIKRETQTNQSSEEKHSSDENEFSPMNYEFVDKKKVKNII